MCYYYGYFSKYTAILINNGGFRKALKKEKNFFSLYEKRAKIKQLTYYFNNGWNNLTSFFYSDKQNYDTVAYAERISKCARKLN